MKKIIPVLLFSSLLLCYAFQQKKTLKGTVWKSTYFKYDNFYHFETDTSGYLESITHPFEGKPMTDKDDFTYKIKGDTLRLFMRDPNEIKYVYVHKKEGSSYIYISVFEFSMGKEILRQEKK
jgi:hypothetical protein